MIGRTSVFQDDGAPRAISRVRASRHAFDLPEQGEEVAEERGEEQQQDGSGHAWLPPGFTPHHHVTPSGRKYSIYAGPDGRLVRSRVEAWRVHSASCEANGGLYVPYTEDGGGEGGVGVAPLTPAPPTLFDVCSPVGSESSTGRRRSGERLSVLARRLGAAASSLTPHALPHGASFELQDLPDDQCGNPNCLVKSRNGRHAGACRFPDPRPRRGCR